MPLLVIANSPDKEAALAGLERWKSKHPEAADASRSRRRAGRLDARPVVDMDPHPSESAKCAGRIAPTARNPDPMTIQRVNGVTDAP